MEEITVSQFTLHYLDCLEIMVIKLPHCCSCLWWWCGLFLTVGLDECTYCRLCQVSTRMSDIQGLDLRSHRLVI